MTQNGTVPSLPLEGMVFAITGGASGIGLATAKSLAQKGATVCIADVDKAALDSASSFFTSQKHSFKASIVDVSKRSDVESWIESIVSEFGRLDGAANVAGIIGKGHGRDAVADLDDDEWDRIIAVNLTGIMYCLRAEVNRVVEGGSIVNVASIHGTKGMHPLVPSLARPFILDSVSKTVPNCSRFCRRVRVCAPCRIRCEQARRDRIDKGGSSGEWPPRGPSERRGSRVDIHPLDAEALGPERSASNSPLRRAKCFPTARNRGGGGKRNRLPLGSRWHVRERQCVRSRRSLDMRR